jgi:hypothetical protein
LSQTLEGTPSSEKCRGVNEFEPQRHWNVTQKVETIAGIEMNPAQPDGLTEMSK